MVCLPTSMAINLCFDPSLLRAIGLLPIEFIETVCLSYLFANNVLGGDRYAIDATSRLNTLVSQLNDLNVNTDYDLLLQSEHYETKYKIKLNEKKLPYLLESKYIMVPTYSYSGEIKDTSILQEHVVGSKEYVLSLGSPQKKLKLAYSGI